MHDNMKKHDRINIYINRYCSVRHYDFWERWIQQYRLHHILQCRCDCPVLYLH